MRTPRRRRTLSNTPIEAGQCWYQNNDNQRIIAVTLVTAMRVYGFNTKSRRPFKASILRFGNGRSDGFSLIGGKRE